jgi:hypothetical protein
MGIVDVFDALRTELPLRVALPVTGRWKNSGAHWRATGAAPVAATFLDRVERC